MELFDTAGNAVPPQAVVSGVRTRDGYRLRVARWPFAHEIGEARGTVAIATGRSEFIEQYNQIVASLIARRFEVVIWDWRGQGQSEREIGHGRRGHVSSFAAYRHDLAAIETQVLRASAPRPWFGLGHSMGAAVLLNQAHDGTSPFERLVLTAPMIDVPLRFKGHVRGLIHLMDVLGLGSRLVPGGREQSPLSLPFEGNILTRDRRQYARLGTAIERLPDLVVGSPTIRWLASAFDLMRLFEDPFYAVATTVPILIVAAGADRIVDTAAIERLALRLKAGACLTIPGARHQLLMETEAVLAQFWTAFDAFIPGEAPRDAGGTSPRRAPVVPAHARSPLAAGSMNKAR